MTKYVRHALGEGIVLLKEARERLRLELGEGVRHEFHVFVLGMDLKVGVHQITPRRLDDVDEPADVVVVGEGDYLGQDAIEENIFLHAAGVGEFLQDEQVSHLVILSLAGLLDPVEDPAGKNTLCIHPEVPYGIFTSM